MPKQLVTARQRAEEFKGNCVYASNALSFDRKDSVVKHIISDKHVNTRQKHTSGPSVGKIQMSVVENFNSVK
ncbi:hypothetical protein PR048_002084 [Dryococelus australis]|uniref:Uncharacterized protein n=1 Tax=Dryococelus australis TaxID=614101 RepID=A0ABQ9IKL4_9NEOP|nr:hypothetical protein PR048_002084 [Dryococelus australis]